jgi:hypothetical protein
VGNSSAAATYDLSACAVLPGLIDTHVHIAWHFGPDGRYRPRDDCASRAAFGYGLRERLRDVDGWLYYRCRVSGELRLMEMFGRRLIAGYFRGRGYLLRCGRLITRRGHRSRFARR